MFGKHMILNALACIYIAKKYGVNKENIKKYLSEFKGAKRRFKEDIINDYIIIDDYAHHPTEIEVTLDAARQKYKDKKIIAIFLPNTYSRTEALKDDFVRVLKKADKAYIMDIHCDREKQSDYPGVTSDLIRNEISDAERVSVEDVDKLLKHKGDVLCFMSCGNIYVILDEFKKIIK